ncbi:MAG: adenylate/guanylate cyclase domain-containing protein [Deltaproteobacteria bacterium]|nr:adenylate/guanylate cyclase domain-containing protein [Deltaproteobacteria bacterium]MCB9786435.1 adenylate/guanylate cyclase domain-containing protein [Deltaproteobacteria bacterium]
MRSLLLRLPTLLAGLCGAVVASCAWAPARAAVSLAGEWRVLVVDGPAAEVPPGEAEPWRPIALPQPLDAAGPPGPGEQVWYATSVPAPERRRGQAIALGHALGALELYVQGHRLGAHAGGPAVYPLPDAVMPADGPLSIALRVDRSEGPPAALGGGAVVGGPLALGDAAELRAEVAATVQAERRTAERSLWLAAFLMMVALLQLHLFSRRPALRSYLWYGLLCASVSVFIGCQAEVWLAFGSYRLDLATIARRVSATLVIVSAVEFTSHFLHDRPPSRALRAVSVAAVGTLCLALVLGVEQVAVTALADAVSAVTAVVLSVAIARAALQGHRPARIIAAGAALFAATTLLSLRPPPWVRDLPLSPVTLGFPALVLSMSLALSDRFTRALAELRATHHATRRFVPYEFLELLERDTIVDIHRGDHVTMDMTVLFSDVRAFTSLAERLGPERSFGFINDYLGVMAPEIKRHHGFIDKYIGDAIMALFPPRGGQSADDAVRAAVASVEAIAAHNAAHRDDGTEPIAVGVGIHTGPLVLGTVGDTDRLSCTVLGDSVNLAARVEALTRRYGVSILITGTARQSLATPDAFRMRRIDRVVARGKSEPVELWEVMDGMPEAALARRLASADPFERALLALLDDDHAAAAPHLHAVLEADPDDGVARWHLEACAAIAESPRGGHAA